jgi:large subunit ribosomal protein L11
MKKVKKILKIHIKAGKANPAPPLGPTLAEQGINIPEFCKKFNDMTKDNGEFTLPVVVTVYEDKSYGIDLKQPLTSELLKQIAGVKLGSGEPNKKKVAKITIDQLKEVAEKKMPDLNTTDIEKAMKIIRGTADSMGIEIQ